MMIVYGIGLILGISLAVSCKDGPFEIFANLRVLGKPFTCSFCMLIWSALFIPSFMFLPEIALVMISAPGYAMVILHATGIHQLFEMG